MFLTSNFPFLTQSDPVTSGEGALDPLGLATISDRLADEILPGLRARMSRPRFLTAMAVSAAVCEGLHDRIASDNVTPSYVVFEWFLVEGFTRATNDREKTRGTPGTLKAQSARDSGQPMCARTYLRVPSIFGFHGVYKPLARHLGIVGDDLRLSDNGYALLKVWQREQKLDGFLDSAIGQGPGTSAWRLFRRAVEDGLQAGCSTRSAGWPGWRLFADHLAPSDMGPEEAAFIYQLLVDAKCPTRAEVFHLLEATPPSDSPESTLVRNILLSRASRALQDRLRAISEFETVCALLEDAFDWVREKARDVFELRYKETVDPDKNRWELCSRVLSRKDVVEKLSESW